MVGNRKNETEWHSLIKHIIKSILERQGHKVHIEAELPDGSFVDVFDETDGIVFEPQSKKQPKIEKEKLRKYMNYALVNDIIFIRPEDFPLDDLIKSDTYKRLRYKLTGK